MKNKVEHEVDKVIKEDLEYFKKQVERGTKRLVGHKTDENMRDCLHCKFWRRTNKFIKEIEKLMVFDD